MRARIARSLVIVWLVAATSLLVASTALADARCNGSKGYQVWEHINFGGRSAVSCVNRSDYSAWNANLEWWQSWNDAVSSAETFNATNWDLYMYRHAGYSFIVLILNGSESVSNFNDWNANDQVSSSRFL